MLSQRDVGEQTIQITAAPLGTPSWTSVPAKQVVRLGLPVTAPSFGAAR